MSIALLLALVLLNGVFAMSEISLVAARTARLRALADEGDRGAAAALRLVEDPTRFLSTVQIGITSIGILNGIVGEAIFSAPLAAWLAGHGVAEKTAGYIATAIVVIVITYVTIVVGELVPKRLGQLHAETIARIVARPMHALAVLTRPFVRLLSGSTDLLLNTFGTRVARGPTVTEEEIHALLAEGSASGVIEEQERQMVRNLFRLDDRMLGSLMVPRGDIVTLDADAPWAENLAKIRETGHSRYPVVRGAELDEILGIVTTRMLLLRAQSGAPEITHDLVAPLFVPESLTGMEVLQNLKMADTELALVVDEYGQVLGMVTLRDVLEAIVGEFKPREPGDAWAIARNDGSWLLDGLIPVPELKDRLRLRAVPEEERGQYHTLSGMLMVLLGRLPKTTDAVEWEGWRFEIVDMDGKQVDKVLATPLPAEPIAPAA